MTYPKTRAQMQTEALIIETLLEAAQASFAGEDISQCLTLVEMAAALAGQLHTALDSINAPKGAI
jgi:hypothetical protein